MVVCNSCSLSVFCWFFGDKTHPPPSDKHKDRAGAGPPRDSGLSAKRLGRSETGLQEFGARPIGRFFGTGCFSASEKKKKKNMKKWPNNLTIRALCQKIARPADVRRPTCHGDLDQPVGVWFKYVQMIHRLA